MRQPGGDTATRAPWRMALAHAAAAGLGDDALAILAPPLEEAQVVIGQLSSGLASPWTSSAGRLFDAVAALLGAVAREQPLLLAIDDLHRADATTALLLRHLLRELEPAPVAFALAYRAEEVGHEHPVASALAEVRPGAERIQLAGLAEEEVADLVHALIGEVPRAELRGTLHERTAGNPLFVTEIARDLAERGGLARSDAWRVRSKKK